MPFAETTNGRVYYESYGDGPPLVIVPAFAATTRTYRGLLPNLIKTHRVLLYDLFGMGQSDDRRKGSTLESMGDDVAALLDHLGIGRASVLGSSMGAIIAQQFAVRHRDRLDRLVLITPPAGKSRHRSCMNEILTALLAACPPEKFIRYMLHLALSPGFVDKHPVVVDQMMGGIRVSEREHETMLRVIRSAHTFQGISGRAEMDAPTLIIAGELDIITPPTQAEILHAELPNSRLIIMKGVAHSPFIEATRETFAAVLSFLTCAGSSEASTRRTPETPAAQPEPKIGELPK